MTFTQSIYLFYLIAFVSLLVPSIFIVSSEEKLGNPFEYWFLILILGFFIYMSAVSGHVWLAMVFCYDLLLWIILGIVESNNKPIKQLRNVVVKGENIKLDNG